MNRQFNYCNKYKEKKAEILEHNLDKCDDIPNYDTSYDRPQYLDYPKKVGTT